MTNGGWILVCALFALLSYVVGFNAKSSNVPSLAFGYEQEKNVWNKIRVDGEGKVICSTQH